MATSKNSASAIRYNYADAKKGSDKVPSRRRRRRREIAAWKRDVRRG